MLLGDRGERGDDGVAMLPLVDGVAGEGVGVVTRLRRLELLSREARREHTE